MDKFMNNKMIKLLLAGMLTFNVMQEPIQASGLLVHRLNNEIDDKFELHKSSIWQSAWLNIGITTALVGLIAASQYISTTYLVQEKHLVETDFPHAQAWYNAMVLKYPQAHLEKKLFLQTMRHVNKKRISWCSTFNHIYFPQDSLKDIDRLYKNKTNGQILSEEEELLLSKEEFILLHEAGHIEHGDIAQRLGFAVAAFASLEMLRAASLNSMLNQTHLTSKNDAKLSSNLFLLEMLALFPFMVNMLSRSHEAHADEFAYEQADDHALVGGISFFESEELDPLINIETKTVSPFVPVDSSVGKVMQAWAKRDDENELAWMKTIKSIPVLRSIYQWWNASSHPYPATRAQAIKNEQGHRAVDNVQN